MKISKTGLELIKHFEGCLLYGYKDVVGVPTIGYGHTGGVVVGQRITQAKADELLQHDLDRFEEAVDRLVTVPINQNQFDALVSFSFNVGSGALQKSTLLKKVNAKDFKDAAKEFLKFNKGRIDGELVVLNGLARRRAAESALFSKPVPVKPHIAQFPYPNYILEKGVKNNPNVKLLQHKFGLVPDGDFGDKTEAKVIAYQKAHKLTPDGRVGKITWNSIF